MTTCRERHRRNGDTGQLYWNSHAPFMQKRALLQACLQKVAKMASDKDALYMSALQKIAEFAALQYPRSTQEVCSEGFAPT